MDAHCPFCGVYVHDSKSKGIARRVPRQVPAACCSARHSLLLSHSCSHNSHARSFHLVSQSTLYNCSPAPCTCAHPMCARVLDFIAFLRLPQLLMASMYLFGSLFGFSKAAHCSRQCSHGIVTRRYGARVLTSPLLRRKHGFQDRCCTTPASQRTTPRERHFFKFLFPSSHEESYIPQLGK
jgi:hypothetical protein